MTPFADNDATVSIGGLCAENGRTVVTLSGELGLTRDRRGLEFARALEQLAGAVVRALEAAGDLPDAVADPHAPPDEVDNPFR